MTLWWANRNQLDDDQNKLIEKIPICQNSIVMGPPGCGKTNILLRRAQYVRSQGYPNVLVLTYTRALTEFIKTGCLDDQNREIFPSSCVNTVESWIRELYACHGEKVPEFTEGIKLSEKKKQLAEGAKPFINIKRKPQYDAIFIDETQDLLPEEINLLAGWGKYLFFVGDNNQKIYGQEDGVSLVSKQIKDIQTYKLRFHYRLAPDICKIADRILIPASGESLSQTCQYKGPKPNRVNISHSLSTEKEQLQETSQRLKTQLQIYGDHIRQGDRFGVIVPQKEDREAVFNFFEADPDLAGRSKVIRARSEGEYDYDPSFEEDKPICIVTVHGSKGLEFRGLHWIFCDKCAKYYTDEHYYTVITRAKTDLEVSCTEHIPEILARIYSSDQAPDW